MSFGHINPCCCPSFLCSQGATGPQGPQGPQGPPGQAQTPAYGGIYSNGLSSRHITARPQNIDMPMEMPHRGVNYDFSDIMASYIVITIPGVYEVNYSIGINKSSGDHVFPWIKALRNGEEIPGGELFSSLANTSLDDYVNFSNSFMSYFVAGDRISLSVSTPATPFYNNLSSARLTVKLLDQY